MKNSGIKAQNKQIIFKYHLFTLAFFKSLGKFI